MLGTEEEAVVAAVGAQLAQGGAGGEAGGAAVREVRAEVAVAAAARVKPRPVRGRRFWRYYGCGLMGGHRRPVVGACVGRRGGHGQQYGWAVARSGAADVCGHAPQRGRMGRGLSAKEGASLQACES